MKNEEVIETIIKDGWFVYKNKEYKVDLVERKQDDWQPLEVDNLPGDVDFKKRPCDQYVLQRLTKYKKWNKIWLIAWWQVFQMLEDGELLRYRKRKLEKPKVGEVCAICDHPRRFKAITLYVDSVENIKLGERFILTPPEAN